MEPIENGDDQARLILSPGVYNKLKFLVQVILPTFGTLYIGLDQIWNLPAEEKVVGTSVLLTTILGGLVAISSKRWQKSEVRFDGVIVPQVDGGGLAAASLELKGDPETVLANKEEITFKVQPVQVG